ncbi:hypothetical protein AX15_004364 [Amanita polypyramis BW_CC]|nr:hypothetical protein AX15_004364 [Amanita polypyramis BW_CC]
MADIVTATIEYGIPPADGARAFQSINENPATGKRDTNWTQKLQEVQIENIRGKEDIASLDTAGFQFAVRPAKYKGEFTDSEEIKREYYPESEELIKELTGASKVVLFNHIIRRNRPGLLNDNMETRQPVLQVHADSTISGSLNVAHRHLPPGEALEHLKRHFQIINLWRPIGVPALEYPLALCDYRSIDPKNDVFPVAVIFPDRETEIYSAKYSANHKWMYLRGMTPDEVILFKSFDSTQDRSVALFTPHTSFEDPTTPEGAPRRQSIEVRALVFYD